MELFVDLSWSFVGLFTLVMGIYYVLKGRKKDSIPFFVLSFMLFSSSLYFLYRIIS